MFNLLTLFLFPILGSMNQANFPEVLTESEEKEYLERWKNKDFNARNILIEHNLRLVAHIVKKFENTKVEKDDLLSIGTFGLIKAVDSYNFESNVRLATYASRCIENEILMHLRNIKKYKDTISLYTPIGEDKEGKLSISDMTVESPNCEERAAVLKAMLKNNSEENLENIMLIIDVKDKDGNYTHKFSITIAKVDAGEELPIEFKTLGRIIDMYDYEFTYVDSSQMAG